MVHNIALFSLIIFFLFGCQVKEGNQSGALIAGHSPAENSFTITLPSNAVRTSGENLQFTLTHPYAVTVTGTPRLTLTIGSTIRYATYQSGSGTRNLIFSHTILTGENDSNGIDILSSIDLNGGTLSFVGTLGLENCNLNLTVPDTTDLKVDSVIPTVSAIAPPANGTYRFGMPIIFQITMSEKVLITGTPRLTLTIGSTTRFANLTSSTIGAKQNLTFSYIPLLNDIDTNGIDLIASIDLNGGTIKDQVGIDSNLNFSAPTTSAILVDANTPYVMSISPPANGNYGSGDVLDFVFNYSEAVIVTGIPSFYLNINGTNRSVVYYSGSNSNQITFRYVVQVGEVDLDGLTATTSFDMTGATIQDLTAVNAINNFLAPSLSQILILENRPVISSFSFNPGTYFIGETITFSAIFNQPVTIIGSPQISLTLDTGDPVLAQYLSGSGTTNIVFSYIVVEGINDTNGLVITGPISLNGGSIKNTLGVNANLAFSSPSTGTLLVNGIRPSISNINGPLPGTFLTGSNLDFSIQFSELVNIHSDANVRLSIQIGSNLRQASYFSGTGTNTINFRYTVTAGDSSSNGISFIGFALSGSGAIKDGTTTQANNANLTFVAPDWSGILVNVATPTVTGVISPTDTMYIIGNQLNFTIGFSENVVVSGSPRLALTVGSTTRYAEYISGSGSSNLIFRYIIQTGDEDANGISASTVIDLNGGSIKSLADANTSLAVPAQSLGGVLVDGVAPSVQSIANPVNNVYTINNLNLTFNIQWNDNVTVTGTPYLALDIGSSSRQANYISGSGTDTLTFSYSLTTNDLDLDGIGLNPIIQLSGGTINDVNGNSAALNVGAQNLNSVLVNFTGMISWWDIDRVSSISTGVCGLAMCATQVSDRSGNSKHITASGITRPEYRSSGFAGGNRAYLQFDNLNMLMTVIGSLTSIRTIFIVFQTEVASMSDQDLFYQGGLTAYVRAGATGTSRYGVVATTSLNGQALTAPASVHAAGLVANTPYVMGVKYNIGYNFSTPFVGSTNFGGKIAEILIYSTDLSYNQMLEVQTYLNLKHQVY